MKEEWRGFAAPGWLPTGAMLAGHFRYNQFVVLENDFIDAAQWDPATEAVCGDQAIEWIAGPAEFQRLLNDCYEGHFIDAKPRVRHDGISQLDSLRFHSSGFGQELYFEQRDR